MHQYNKKKYQIYIKTRSAEFLCYSINKIKRVLKPEL